MNEKFNLIEEQKLSKLLVDSFGLEIFNPGLERTKDLFLPVVKQIVSKGIKVITITGTNGKGQTAHGLAHLLNQNNRSYALWTSPHILSVRERFNFGNLGENSNIGYTELSKKIYDSKEFIDNTYPNLKISYYEFLFFVFLNLSISDKIKVEYLILEVGLGGRLDAVNHLDAEIVALTSISRDHQLILGNRYDQILGEKLGVCRKNSRLISNIKLDYLKYKINQFCKINNIEWINLAQSNNYFKSNQLLSMAIFKYFFPNSNYQLDFPMFKGRQEEMSFKGNSLYFVGAHNVDGVRSMVQSKFLESIADGSSLNVLLSFSKRSYEELNIMLKLILSYKDVKCRVLLTSFQHDKAVDKRIMDLLYNENLNLYEGQLEFVKSWKEELLHFKNEKVLVCGSYYFIGEIQRYIYSIL